MIPRPFAIASTLLVLCCGLATPRAEPGSRFDPVQAAGQAPGPASVEVPPQRDADTLPQDAGVYGTPRPEVSDVRLADTLVHEDQDGRAQHQFVGLAGAAGHGFAGVWRDMRDGNAGLYFGRLDASATPLEPERPLYPQGSSARELEPAIALGPEGRGAFVWFSSAFPAQSLKLRTFDASGAVSGGFTVVDAPTRDEPTGGAGARRGGGRLPAIAHAGAWGAVVWADGDRLCFQRFDSAGALAGGPGRLSADDRPLGGAHRVCRVGERILCAWSTRDGVDVAWIGADSLVRGPGLPGVLERVVPAPDGAGAWALVLGPAGHRLRLLTPSGDVARELDPLISPRESCDVAAREHDLALLVQRGGGALELLALDPREAAPRPKKLLDLDLAGTLASTASVASSGAAVLVAWTGAVGRQTDVWVAGLDARGAPIPTRRWNTDEASAPQNHGRIASRGGDRAVIAWLDGRTGRDRLLARWLAADGRFLGGEFAVGLAADGTELAGDPVEPSLAMGADGTFVVGWKQVEKRGYRLLARAFDGAGAPRSPLFEIDAGEDDPPLFKADLDVAARGRGFALAYGRKDRGAFVRALELGADRPLGDAVQVSDHPLCQHLTLAELDAPSGGIGAPLVVAWDITVPNAGNHAVRGRVLGPALETTLPTLEPPLSIFGDDWDPVVAPAPGGGFALAFCGGVQHSRDVFLRFFDARGRVDGPLVPISSRLNEQDWPAITRLTDGSLCVAFEDDLSAYDHVYVRRVTRGEPDGGPLRGEIRTLNQREAVFNENRVIPRLAPLAGGGFAAVWVDARRARGTDVRVKIVGPGFDARAR